MWCDHWHYSVVICGQVEKLEVVNKKWVRVKLVPGTQVDGSVSSFNLLIDDFRFSFSLFFVCVHVCVCVCMCVCVCHVCVMFSWPYFFFAECAVVQHWQCGVIWKKSGECPGGNEHRTSQLCQCYLQNRNRNVRSSSILFKGFAIFFFSLLGGLLAFWIYWVVQAGLFDFDPLTFTQHRLAVFTSDGYFLHNGRQREWICEVYSANFKGIFEGP